mmetsp:Transcript_28887/g.94044  ORF Transcript_28887/g.94044 Transcript_28887/m.94044 type:complete len:255 (-) Transcript_28887:115-879(-)
MTGNVCALARALPGLHSAADTAIEDATAWTSCPARGQRSPILRWLPVALRPAMEDGVRGSAACTVGLATSGPAVPVAPSERVREDVCALGTPSLPASLASYSVLDSASESASSPPTSPSSSLPLPPSPSASAPSVSPAPSAAIDRAAIRRRRARSEGPVALVPMLASSPTAAKCPPSGDLDSLRPCRELPDVSPPLLPSSSSSSSSSSDSSSIHSPPDDSMPPPPCARPGSKLPGYIACSIKPNCGWSCSPGSW